MSRARACEICGRHDGLESVDCGTRLVVLCDTHAASARASGASSLDALRELFVETLGRRALLPRRAESGRRMFPPRPEGRRRRDGRRTSDGASCGAATVTRK